MKNSAAAPAEPARRCLRAAGVSDDHLRDRGVHLVTQGLIICGAGSRRLQQFNLHPFRHDDAGVGCDGAQCRQQPVTLFELRIDQVGALGSRLAEFFQEHQPELDAVALEEHWPVQPVREAPGLPARGSTCRCAAAPAGSRVFSPAIIRFHQKRRADIRPVDKAGTLHPSLWCHSKYPAGFPHGTAPPRRAVCRCRTFPRHDGSPQRGCVP